MIVGPATNDRTFRTVDVIIRIQLMKWARRTHPNKSVGWLKKKYFSAAGPGTFSTEQDW
jgi:RNA-directed DNA polymerase